MELQEKDPKKKEDTIELLNKMLRIVHKISEVRYRIYSKKEMDAVD
jgi:hypothetical protein